MPVAVSSGAAVAIGASAAASAAAYRAHVNRCEATIHNYDSRTATISEMQSYSECVDFIHPKPDGMPQGAAIAILVSLILGAIAGYIVRKITEDSYNMGIGGTILSIFVGAFCGVCALFFGGLFVCIVMKAVGAA